MPKPLPKLVHSLGVTKQASQPQSYFREYCLPKSYTATFFSEPATMRTLSRCSQVQKRWGIYEAHTDTTSLLPCRTTMFWKPNLISLYHPLSICFIYYLWHQITFCHLPDCLQKLSTGSDWKLENVNAIQKALKEITQTTTKVPSVKAKIHILACIVASLVFFSPQTIYNTW